MTVQFVSHNASCWSASDEPDWIWVWTWIWSLPQAERGTCMWTHHCVSAYVSHSALWLWPAPCPCWAPIVCAASRSTGPPWWAWTTCSAVWTEASSCLWTSTSWTPRHLHLRHFFFLRVLRIFSVQVLQVSVCLFWNTVWTSPSSNTWTQITQPLPFPPLTCQVCSGVALNTPTNKTSARQTINTTKRQKQPVSK